MNFDFRNYNKPDMQSKDFQIDWLRSFVAIVDTGSVKAAARQVARSQSAVSMQLKKLETSVGRALLDRGPLNMTPTPAGYDLLVHARALLDIHATAVRTMHGGSVSGRVSLGVPDDYVGNHLTPALSTFGSKHSEVALTLVCEPSTVLLDKLQRDEVDLALMTRDRPNRGELLFKERLIWVGSEQHIAWKQNPLPIALHSIDNWLRTVVLGALAAQGRSYRVVYNSANVTGQLAIAASGLGVALTTECSLPAHLKELDGRHGMPGLPELEVALVRSKESRHSAAVDALYEHLVRSLKNC